MHPEQISILVRKLLDKTASAEEIAQINAYLTEKDIDLDVLLPWADWETTGTSPMPASTRERVLASIFHGKTGPQTTALPGALSSRDPKYTAIHRKGRIRVISLVAATAAAAILLFVLVLPRLFPGTKRVHGQEFIAYSAERGHSRMVILPDSSRIYLNAGSTISYSQAFGDSDRRVMLSGEAFFEVAPLRDRPFTVKTGNLLTTVLGTSFNVKAYNKKGDYFVSVRSGKVKVTADTGRRADHEPYLLLPGQQAGYASLSGAFTIRQVDTAGIASWKDNELLFDGSPLEEILETLEYRYNVRFQPEPGLIIGKKYSVTFHHLDLQASLDKLSILGKLCFERHSDSLIVVKQTGPVTWSK